MNNKIVCHSPSERCYGCDHYHGKADVCKYAPEMTDEKIKPVAWCLVYNGPPTNTDIHSDPTMSEAQIKARFNGAVCGVGTGLRIGNLYPESALLQAKEEGRQAGLREAAEICKKHERDARARQHSREQTDEPAEVEKFKVIAGSYEWAAHSITRAAEGK
jgi:hypothetical protein